MLHGLILMLTGTFALFTRTFIPLIFLMLTFRPLLSKASFHLAYIWLTSSQLLLPKIAKSSAYKNSLISLFRWSARATGADRNFDWEEPKLEKYLWRNFGDVLGDVMMMTLLKWHHNYFLKFDFVIISLKIHNFAKSLNSRSPNLKV